MCVYGMPQWMESVKTKTLKNEIKNSEAKYPVFGKFGAF